MNETNRFAIVLLAAAWIVLMAVLIFVTWTAPEETIARLRDFVDYLDDHQDNASRLILTLGALVLIVLSFLAIIVELAPEEEARELRVEQAGATTIVPGEAVRGRLEEVLAALPQVREARARVATREKALAVTLDLVVVPGSNVATVSQEASRTVAETLEQELGLPLAAPPSVRITFGGARAEPVASSLARPPLEGSEAPPEPPTGGEGEAGEAPPPEGPADEQRP